MTEGVDTGVRAAAGAEPVWVHHFGDDLGDGVGDAVALLGGKGASLRAMTLANLAVPPGFTLTTACCARFYEAGNHWPDGLEAQVREHLHRLERETGRTFGRGPRPLLVSVRSGAAVSMPGMMDTILNCGLNPSLADSAGGAGAFANVYTAFIRSFAGTVRGFEDEELAAAVREAGADPAAPESWMRAYERLQGEPFPTDPWECLVHCINAVFGSWHSERAEAYRHRHHIRGLPGTAVNVQAMFPSEVSGVVFTRDPSQPDANRMVIEASLGLGESVVSGEVTPDRFLVERETLAIATTVGRKHAAMSAFGGGAAPVRDPGAACLTEEQVRELAGLSLRMEAHFGYALDIEFGLAEGRFGLLQSRRIRGLEVLEEVAKARAAEADRLLQLSGGKRKCWVVHNLSETLRAPTPFTWGVVRRFMSGDGGFGRMYTALGYRPSERVRREGFLELIAGRIYADPDRAAELFWDALPLTYTVEEVLADRNALDHAPTRLDPDRADARFLGHLPVSLWRLARASRRMKRGRAGALERFQKAILPPYLDYVAAERARDLAALSEAEVIGALHERRRRVLDEFGPESLLPGFFGGLAFDDLRSHLAELAGAEDGGRVAEELTRGLDGDMTFTQDAMLLAVARGEASLADFLAQFGHRCVGEMELATPRWRENPSWLEGVIRNLAARKGRTPTEIHDSNVAARREMEARLPALLKGWGASVFRERLERDMREAQALLPYRETGKHYLMMGYELIRLAAEELARRWDLGGRFYYLEPEELETFASCREERMAAIEARRVRHPAWQRLWLPEVIDSEALDRFGEAPKVESAESWTGVAVSPGVATGPARIVIDPQTAGDLGAGYVLVCPSTDPGWTPLFLNACALVVERGGVLSHGAIVARDFGIPAVVVEGATRAIADGVKVRVDGNSGHLSVVDGNGKRPGVS